MQAVSIGPLIFAGGRLAAIVGIGALVTLFIGADGKLRFIHVGEISREALKGAISRLIAE